MNVAAEAVALITRRDWLALATTGDSCSPASSYVPFAIHDAAFAIAVSRLSAHTAHLSARPTASVLLVGEPAEEEGAFARPRLSMEVDARFIPRGSSESTNAWDALEKRFGVIVGTLRELTDFETVALAPVSARLILGFAAASDLDATVLHDLLRARGSSARRGDSFR